jgi:hypothetical protein
MLKPNVGCLIGGIVFSLKYGLLLVAVLVENFGVGFLVGAFLGCFVGVVRLQRWRRCKLILLVEVLALK